MSKNGHKLRRETERTVRQRLVLDAARRLYASKGIENTRMEDIAEAAEYTRRTLYSYFKGRDEICLLVMCEDLRRRWAIQKEAIARADNGLAKILAWAETFYAISREDPHSLHLQLYWDIRGLDRDRISTEVFNEFESVNGQLAEGLREIFRLGIDDGTLRPDLSVDAAISQYLYTLRTVLHRALSPAYSFASFDPDEYVRHYLDLFSRGIRNHGRTMSWDILQEIQKK